VEGYPDEGYDRPWLTGLWSTQAKVEGIMLKAVWHWVSDCGVVNDPLGEPGSTPLYKGVPKSPRTMLITRKSLVVHEFPARVCCGGVL
jgi:hypothetical protein